MIWRDTHRSCDGRRRQTRHVCAGADCSCGHARRCGQVVYWQSCVQTFIGSKADDRAKEFARTGGALRPAR
jgi:hypothetical protein